MAEVRGFVAREKYDQFKLEEFVKEFWERNDIYRLVKEKSKSSPRKFYFLDGPPYASAKSIHVGTAWNKVIKDVVLRYYRMMGYNVWDTPGFDTHGLPIEVYTEKRLGIKSKKEIEEKIGVDKFINECRNFAKENIDAMTEQFKEIGVFMDWDNPYITYKPEYVESGWWLIKQTWKKGLLYEGRRVVHWCPRCETTLADYEVSEYRELEDPSIFVKFKVKGKENEYILIWTTTPWTLPANAFVMAHPELMYVRVRVGNDILLLAKARLEHVMKQAGIEDYEIIEEVPGDKLEGIEYIHPLEDIVPAQKLLAPYHRIVMAPEAVTATEGTGLVHSAPGHGEIDFEINEKKVKAPLISLVGNDGRMLEDAGKYAGLYFRTEANEAVIKDLESLKAIFYRSTIKHRYPVCWRCKTPLVLRATTQWFIGVTKIKDKLLEEADKIEWRPHWAKTRFMNLIKDIRDWVISRQRYWGIPLPVWRCEKCGYTHAIGGVDELVELGGEKPEDPHRPWIDNITLKCPKCGGVMKRVPDVLDVWFDSGVAFYASLNYPRNKELYEKLRPVDFITEGHDQIRGWFFSLLRSGVIGFNEKPYTRVLVHGFALDKYGREMHKSLGNYIEFTELVSKVPRDVIRLWAMNNTIWEDLRFSFDAMNLVARSFNIIWNVFSFAATYMEMDHFDPEIHRLEDLNIEDLAIEDRWLLSRINKLLKKYHEAIRNLYLHDAAKIVKDFPVEDLSHWYIRLVRKRVWKEEETRDKIAAYTVLYYALKTWLLMAAPFIPFTTEYLYQKFVRPAEPESPISIHLMEIPEPYEEFIDDKIEYAMNIAKEIVEAASAARMQAGLKIRRPVRKLLIALRKPELSDIIKSLYNIIRDQVNVKEIEVHDIKFFEQFKIFEVEPVYKTLGPEFKSKTKYIIKYININKNKIARDIISKGKHEATINGETITLKAKHIKINAEYPSWLSTVETSLGIIGIDTRLSEEEILEGHARDLVRRIQAMRKEAGLNVEAYIETWIKGDKELLEAARKFENYIKNETRSTVLHLDEEPPADCLLIREWEVDGLRVKIGIKES